LALAIATFAPLAHADRVRLADGRLLEGTIERRARDPQLGEMVTIALPQGRIILPADQVLSVAPSTPRERALLEARDNLRVGRPGDAVAAMDRVLRLGGPADGPAALLIEHGPALARQVGALSADRLTALRRVLAAVEGTALAESSDLTYARLWLHLALNDAAGVAPLFARLVPAYFDGHPDRRRALADWLGGRIDACNEAQDEEHGAGLLDALARVDPALADGRRVQFYLRWARRCREAGDFEQSLKIYTTNLLPISPQIARELTSRTLEHADHTYSQRNEESRVIELYRRYGLPTVPDAARRRLVQIWRNQGWRALRRSAFDEAEAAFRRADAVTSGSAAKDLTQLEFRRRRRDVPDDDPIARYELAVWANNHQLDDEALDEFRATRASKIVGDNAQAYIGQILNRQAEGELKRLMSLYDAGQYREVLNGVYQFQQQGYAAGYQDQARRLQDLTMNALQIALAQRPQQAQAFYQQAERAFYQEHYEEAAQKLQIIFDHYQDTLVYPQARNLYARVHERLALARIEQGATQPPTAAKDLTTSPTLKQSPIGGEIDDLYRSLERTHRNDS
jgi:tetratricopeptide (TPR) repeat protein